MFGYELYNYFLTLRLSFLRSKEEEEEEQQQQQQQNDH
ncbi:MAG: hypothetical protein ACI8RD_011071 [Bacillariaceae sp.]|jgi:hypothetical protein